MNAETVQTRARQLAATIKLERLAVATEDDMLVAGAVRTRREAEDAFTVAIEELLYAELSR